MSSTTNVTVAPMASMRADRILAIQQAGIREGTPPLRRPRLRWQDSGRDEASALLEALIGSAEGAGIAPSSPASSREHRQPRSVPARGRHRRPRMHCRQITRRCDVLLLEGAAPPYLTVRLTRRQRRQAAGSRVPSIASPPRR